MKEKPKVLIIEDEMPVAMVIRFLLGMAGCESQIANSGSAGIRLAESECFDLITMDVNMPDANGFELCSQLKRNPRLHSTPIVFVSGNCSLEDQQRGLDVGAADYINKPFETFDFAPRLLSHIKDEKPQLSEK